MPDQMKSETAFLSGLSHALRSPLVSIRGYNDLLLTETQGPLTVKQRRSLERMRQSIIQLLDVVERLLDQATRGGEQVIAPPAATAISSKKKKLRIVVVEDSVDIGDLMRFVLADRGHQVRIITSAAEALTIGGDVDLVILDITLSDANGLDVCRRLKSQAATENVAVLVVTASSGSSMRKQALAAGACDLLLKPFDIDEFVQRVELHGCR